MTRRQKNSAISELKMQVPEKVCMVETLKLDGFSIRVRKYVEDDTIFIVIVYRENVLGNARTLQSKIPVSREKLTRLIAENFSSVVSCIKSNF